MNKDGQVDCRWVYDGCMGGWTMGGCMGGWTMSGLKKWEVNKSASNRSMLVVKGKEPVQRGKRSKLKKKKLLKSYREDHREHSKRNEKKAGIGRRRDIRRNEESWETPRQPASLWGMVGWNGSQQRQHHGSEAVSGPWSIDEIRLKCTEGYNMGAGNDSAITAYDYFLLYHLEAQT